jgi:putative membrane protein
MMLTSVMLLSLMAADDRTKDVKVDDAGFAQMACCLNLTEIKLGRMAAGKAKDEGVRAFAERMVRDHLAAQEALKDACKGAKKECPAEQSKDGKEACAKCEKLTGKEFDRGYIEFQMKSHEKAVKALEKAADELSSESLREYARKQLPIVKEHKEMAKKLHERLSAVTR